MRAANVVGMRVYIHFAFSTSTKRKKAKEIVGYLEQDLRTGWREGKAHYKPTYIISADNGLVSETIVEGIIAFLEHAILAPLSNKRPHTAHTP